MPRLLYICRRLPWPLHGGAALRNYWTLVALSKHYDVDVFATLDGSAPVPDFPLRLGISAFKEPIRFFRVRRVMESLCFGVPYFSAGQIPKAMRVAVEIALASTSYRAIHISELTAILAVPPRSDVPLIYDAHNCESDLLRRRANFEGVVARAFMQLDADRVRRLETHVLKRAALITATSYKDIDDLDRIVPGSRKKAFIVHNGVDVEGYAECSRQSVQSGSLLITGSINWRPNFQGLQWFLKEVLPILHASGKVPEIRIAGKMTDSQAEQLSRIPGVVAVQNPENMHPELMRAIVVLVPVRASSGTRLRILEAWAAGRPVVATPAGALGLDQVRSEHDLMISESPQEFAGAILSLLQDSALWRRVRDAGLKKAVLYDWGRIGESILDAHKSTLPVAICSEVMSGRA